MAGDHKLGCLFAALLLMSAFYYAFENPGPLRPGRDVSGRSAVPGQAIQATIVPPVEAGRPERAEQTKPAENGESDSSRAWFDALAERKKNEPEFDDETLAKARQLQEERLSRELSKSPRKLTNSTLSDARLPALALSGTSISGAMFINCELPDFKAENMTFNQVKFHRVKISKAAFKNVTFNDCIFENSNIDHSVLENVAFNRGEFRHVRLETVRGDILTGIFNSSFNNTGFDGVGFKNANIDQADGEITLLNLNAEKNPFSAAGLVSGAGLTLRVENSRFKDVQFGYLGNNSRLYATNSTFVNSGTRSGSGGSLYFENCRFESGASIASQGTVLLRGCRVNSRIDAGKSSDWYFDACEFEEDSKRGGESAGTVITAEDGAALNIKGGGNPARLTISYRGTLRLQDLTLQSSKLESRGWPIESDALDLLEVTIAGGDLGNLNPRSGSWQNVTLTGRIKTNSRTGFKEVKANGLTVNGGDSLWDGPVPALPRETGVVWPGIKMPSYEALIVHKANQSVLNKLSR